jgi:hypothetical protein
MPGGEVLEAGDEFSKISMKADQEKGIFPLKVRSKPTSLMQCIPDAGAISKTTPLL